MMIISQKFKIKTVTENLKTLKVRKQEMVENKQQQSFQQEYDCITLFLKYTSQ